MLGDSLSVARKMLPSVTEEQLGILLKAAENQRDKCIVSLLFDSGLRLSELCAIKLSDIDWSSNAIRGVVKVKEQDGETGPYYHAACYYAPWLGRRVSPDTPSSSPET
jgi:integrase